jgi:hypothetical protein
MVRSVEDASMNVRTRQLREVNTARYWGRLAVATVTLFVALQFWSASVVRSAPQGSPKKTQPTKMPQARASPCPPAAPDADVTKLVEASRNRNRHEALLDYAQRLTNEGSYSEANTTIVGVLKETNDAEIVTRARKQLEKNLPGTPARLGLSQPVLFRMASWWIDILLGSLMLLALYVVLRIARYIWSMTQRGNWRLDPIADPNSLGVAESVIQSLGKWGDRNASLTSGLLRLERLQLPSVEWLRPSATTLDLSDALKDLSIKIGGNLVGLSGIASAGKGIKNWLNATCPAIRGKATTSASMLTVSLTAQSADGTAWAVTESRMAESAPASSPPQAGLATAMAMAPTFSPADIQSAAQSASYKIFYLISRSGSTMREADAANSLREGLNLLWQHVSTQDPQKLFSAYKAFQESRTRSTDFYQAYLYEGIALDLLSQHDEAIERFKYLEAEKRLRDEGLRRQAKYNKAISLFRKYQKPASEEAERVLNELISDIEENFETSQIKSMALAAKASVIAQAPMYCSHETGREEQDEAVQKRENEKFVKNSIDEVLELKEKLEGILRTVKREGKWDRGAERQLEWAINNAWGSVYLNVATYLYAESDSENRSNEWLRRRREYLAIAYRAFQSCAMLLTPGVENLTDLAKVTLELGRFAQGCAYLEEVRKMNPSYEYAYFRLAKEWDTKHKSAKVVEILKSFGKRTPMIPAFVALTEKYENELSA